MTLNEYQALAMRTATLDRPEIDILCNAALGLVGEAGEVADMVKKHLYQGHMLDADAVIDEVSDVLWYCALAANAVGVGLEEIAAHNVEKLRKRYPDGFDPSRSVHREDA